MAVALVAASPPTSRAATADYLMCDWKVEARTQSVSIDPQLAGTGISYEDVLAAFDAWNALFERYYGFPIFAPHYGNWWEADVLIAANVYQRTWVHGRCYPGYVQRGNNHSIVFLGAQDAWRNREMLAHELGHALGLADHGPEASRTDGHIGYKGCDTYIGVMSYCTSPQSWFLDYDLAPYGFATDGQLVRDYWKP